MSKDHKKTQNIKPNSHSHRLRDHWTAEMREAFALGRQPRDNTAQLGRPRDAEDRTLSRLHKLMAAFVIGAPAAILMAAVAVRALASG